MSIYKYYKVMYIKFQEKKSFCLSAMTLKYIYVQKYQFKNFQIKILF